MAHHPIILRRVFRECDDGVGGVGADGGAARVEDLEEVVGNVAWSEEREDVFN